MSQSSKKAFHATYNAEEYAKSMKQNWEEYAYLLLIY
jgi:hypothetical protein